MKKVLQINLGNIAFTVDEDAFVVLDRYIDSINRHFSDSEGCEEIVHDIEIRLAELFQERLQNRQVITLKDVQEVIAVMGTPADFGVAEEEEPLAGPQKGFDQSGFRPGKRLFRNPDDKVIGGVCSGISAYLGIEDPVWIRLAFALLLLGGGFGLFLYMVLMIIVPVAKTSSDKLSMRGKPININNIADAVEKEIHDLGDKLQDLSKDWGSKKKGMTDPVTRREQEPGERPMQETSFRSGLML